MKSLDSKLAQLKKDRNANVFIIADAKDADMAFGIKAPGPRYYLSSKGARAAQFSPEIWTREEFGYRNLIGVVQRQITVSCTLKAVSNKSRI